VLNTHTDNESALLKFTWTPNPDQRLELSHRYFNSSFGEIMPSAIGRVGESNEWVTYVDKANTMFQFEPGKCGSTPPRCATATGPRHTRGWT
jgi:hemoglobin/transferrin/lactoferrin receptor protein